MIKSILILAPVVLALSLGAEISNAAERNGFRSGNAEGQAQTQVRDSRRRHENPNARAERLFNKLDTDNSGVITLDEFLAKALRKAAIQFNRIDTGDDGLVSLDEFLAIHHGRSNRSDIDVDTLRACISERSEIAGFDLPDRTEGFARFLAVDTNEDGFIDLGEFEAAKTEKATNKFNRIDTNNDGGITLEELIAALKQHHERRAIRRACVEAQRDLDSIVEG
ncbi:MAG: EF-hand domain-containing protein [Pseudomonadales bacterium]|nr:EF-hand domain-containing protein [Pseudomonadales bacterium]